MCLEDDGHGHQGCQQGGADADVRSAAVVVVASTASGGGGAGLDGASDKAGRRRNLLGGGVVVDAFADLGGNTASLWK
jgi:hypothetical protein